MAKPEVMLVKHRSFMTGETYYGIASDAPNLFVSDYEDWGFTKDGAEFIKWCLENRDSVEELRAKDRVIGAHEEESE